MPSSCPLCLSNQDDSRCHTMSHHLATAASFHFFFKLFSLSQELQVEYHVAQRDEQICSHMSMLHSLSNCILCAPGWHRNAGKKQKYWHVQTPGRLTDTLTENICLSMISSVCSVTPGVTAGYLHTKVSERLTRSDVTRSKLHRNANKDSKKTFLRRQSQTVFTQMAILSSIHLFLLHLCVHFLFFPSSFCLQEDV